MGPDITNQHQWQKENTNEDQVNRLYSVFPTEGLNYSFHGDISQPQNCWILHTRLPHIWIGKSFHIPNWHHTRIWPDLLSYLLRMCPFERRWHQPQVNVVIPHMSSHLIPIELTSTVRLKQKLSTNCSTFHLIFHSGHMRRNLVFLPFYGKIYNYAQ